LYNTLADVALGSYSLVWIEILSTQKPHDLWVSECKSATFSNGVLRDDHVFWGNKHVVMVQPVVGGVVVPLRRAATPRQPMASFCSCTFC